VITTSQKKRQYRNESEKKERKKLHLTVQDCCPRLMGYSDQSLGCMGCVPSGPKVNQKSKPQKETPKKIQSKDHASFWTVLSNGTWELVQRSCPVGVPARIRTTRRIVFLAVLRELAMTLVLLLYVEHRVFRIFRCNWKM
jgi:hypothetical protein